MAVAKWSSPPAEAAMECPEGTNNDSESNETAHLVPAKL
jgi:hypothetical protein